MSKLSPREAEQDSLIVQEHKQPPNHRGGCGDGDWVY